MLEIAKIELSTIAYVTEKLDLVFTALKNCLPEKFRNLKIKRKIVQSQFGDRLVFLEASLRYNPEIFNYWRSKLSDSDRRYLHRHVEKHIELEAKNMYFRLSKFSALDEELKVTSGSDVVKVIVKYSAFTQDQNQMENVVNMLLSHGLILP